MTGAFRGAGHAMRYWLQKPVYAAIIVATLSIGLGVNAAVLSFTRAVLSGAVPFEDVHRIVRVFEANQGQEVEDMESSIPTFQDWRETTTSFEAMGASSAPINVVLRSGGRYERVRSTLVTPSLFRVTGARAAAGRLLDGGDDLRPGAHPVAMIGEAFWRSHFNGDPAAIGATLNLNDAPYEVVGVLPRGYPDVSDPAGRTDVWLPMMMAPEIMGRDVYDLRVLRAFRVLGKLREGVTIEAARNELSDVEARLARVHPESQEGWSVRVVSIREDLLGSLRGPAIALLAGAGLLLVIACANAGFLLLLRTAERQGEFALRLALGASAGHLVRRLAGEVLVVVGASVILALVLAAEVMPAAARNLPATVPGFVGVAMGRPAVLGTLAVSSLIVVGLCLLPLAQSRRLSLTSALSGGGRASRARAVSGLERGLIVSQVATASVLAFGSILLLRSLGALQAEDIGFETDRLLTARVDVSAESRPPEQLPTTARELLLAARSTPGVATAHLWSPHVPGEAVWMSRFHVEDRPELADHEIPGGRIHGVTPGAASAIGMSFVEGRDIDEADLTAGRRVALVSETVARELWPGSSAIGKRLRKWNWEEWVTVVGVVKDVRHAGRQGPGSEFARDFYFPMDQAAELGRDLVVLAKPIGGLDPIASALRSALREAAPDLPVYDLRSMASRLRRQESVPRLTAFLSSAYAGVALILAGLGLYTILTYAAERRRREIGLRMALGASGALIATELTREGLRTGFLGVAIGLVGSLAAAWGLRSILYRIGPVDLPTFLAAAALLLALALAGSGIPAFRAARWSPARLLRGE